MGTQIFRGTWTALITPFRIDGSLDEAALRKLVQRQIENGITGLVPVGTTGESPTTTTEEDTRIFEIVVEEAKGKALVMAGTGSNCTRDAVEYTKHAKAAGVDACLVVSPYYNKPTKEGLKQHYKAIADVGLPLIVYNIKGRTGINIDTDTLMEIATYKNVVGVKEASGDLNQMQEVLERRPDNFVVLSGDDGLTLELIKKGGDGVISVATNVVPKEVVQMVNAALEGRTEEAERKNEALKEMFSKLFIETNPIPVKYAVHKLNLCELVYRLPMCAPSEKAEALILDCLKSYKLL